MKRLFITLLTLSSTLCNVWGHTPVGHSAYIEEVVNSHRPHNATFDDSQLNDLHGPITPFIGFWWSYLYPDPTENTCGISVDCFSKEALAKFTLSKSLLKKIDGIRIVSVAHANHTGKSKCSKNVYNLLITRIKAMVEQIEEEAKICNPAIVTKLKGYVHSEEYNLAIYYAPRRNRSIKNMRDQLIIVRYSDLPNEHAFVVEIIGSFNEDDLFFDLDINNFTTK